MEDDDTDLLGKRDPPSSGDDDGGIAHTYENSLQRKNFSISPNGRRERFHFWTEERPVQASPETCEYANAEDICPNERVYANTLPRRDPDFTGISSHGIKFVLASGSTFILTGSPGHHDSNRPTTQSEEVEAERTYANTIPRQIS